ncbi:MAG: prephenate dehydratase [Cyanobacteriota bacterium]|nr:prephenate dehydratase [Cyanobacteriota bacterium]
MTISPETIAYLGPPGTYSEIAALAAISNQKNSDKVPMQLIPCLTISSVLEAVKNDHVDWAIVPVENSIEGGVAMTLDTLWRLPDLHIQYELVLPIRHALISQSTNLQNIQTVITHPQALGQCQLWLHDYLPHAEQVSSNSTTEALDKLKTNPELAVIGSERAAELYNIPILYKSINDHPDNKTRFWVIKHNKNFSEQVGIMTSLAFSLPQNIPGALLRPLQVFADQEINMSRIESRPTKKSAGTYVFFIDLEHPQYKRLPNSIVMVLQEICETLKILGSYCRIELQ